MAKTLHIRDDLYSAELKLLYMNTKIIKLPGDDAYIENAYEDIRDAVELIRRARERLAKTEKDA